MLQSKDSNPAFLAAIARAREDFKASSSSKLLSNPYSSSDDVIARDAWAEKINELSCHKAHGVVLRMCCWEHNRHLGRQVTRSYFGVDSCVRCEPLADQERFSRWIDAGKDAADFQWADRIAPIVKG